MRTRRPGAVTAAAVLAIIYGSAFTLCGFCNLVSTATQGVMGNRFFVRNNAMPPEEQKKMQDAVQRAQKAMEADAPNYQAYQISSAVLGLAEAVILLIAGIGLLNMQRWARTLAIVVCLLAVFTTVLQAIYLGVIVMPAMSRAFQLVFPGVMAPAGAAQAGAAHAAQGLKFLQNMLSLIAVLTILFYVVLVVYLLIILFLLTRRRVRAAFAGEDPGGHEDRRFDEDERWKE